MKRLICFLAIMLVTFLLAAAPCMICGCGDGSSVDSDRIIEDSDGEGDSGFEDDAVDEEEDDGEGASKHTPPVGFGYGPVQGGSGGIMLLKDVTFAESGNYERVVIELTTGQGNPPREGVCMYSATMGELPYSDLEVNQVEVEGDYYFEITLDSRTADLNLPDAPNVYEGPEVFDVDMELIEDAVFVNAYADHTIILLIGLAEWVPYRVEEMSNPSRIAIDFAP